jgi:hypothetical protein
MRVRAGKQLRSYNHCRNQVNKGHANPHQGARILPVRFGQRNLRQRSSRGARRTPEARTSASWDLVRCLRSKLSHKWLPSSSFSLRFSSVDPFRLSIGL